MSSSSAFDATATGRLRQALRSWLHGNANEIAPPAGEPLDDSGEARADQAGPLRVLVVDDNPVNLMIISAQMQSLGVTATLAGDGAEAVALACEWPFDLILMDLQMPILDGLGATSAIRRFESANARPSVPVLAFTSMSPGLCTLARHGLNGSLNKPCEDHELAACLTQWCSASRPEPALPATQIPWTGRTALR